MDCEGSAQVLTVKQDIEKPVKICEWCKKSFEPKHGNEKYHPGNCQKEAKRDKSRLRKRKYDKKYPDIQKKDNIEKLGTFDLAPFKLYGASGVTYLGILIFQDAWEEEYRQIHKLHEKISVTSYSKGSKPDTSHKGVSLNDRDSFSVTLLLENCIPCPVCGDQLQERDLTRCELICRNPDCTYKGGLVLRGTQFNIDYPEAEMEKMAYTSQDIAKAQSTKGMDRELKTSDIAWDNFWQGK